MKYWVYKDSRILGPFDKEGVSGLPGLDAGTLVCAGDPDRGGAWTPVGELADLAAAATAGPVFSPSDFPSGSGLLDRLQIETAGLIGDADFPALAEDLFSDASLKQGFADILSAGSSPAEGELRRAKETSAALTAKLEAMYKRMAELEASNAELLRRLNAGEGAAAAAAPASPTAPPQSSTPVLPPAPATAPPEAPPPFAGAPTDWPTAPAGGTIPSFGAAAPSAPPPTEPPAAETPALVPGFGDLPSTPEALAPAPALPEMPALGAGAPPPPAAPPATPGEEKPKALSFGKPKSFKVAPAVKSFKVVGPESAAAVPAAPPAPAPASPPASQPPTLTPPPPPAPADLAPTMVAPQAPPPPAAEQVAPPPSSPPPAAPPPPAPAAGDGPIALDAAALDPLKMQPPPPVPEAAPPAPRVSDLVGEPAAAPVPSFTDLMSPPTPAPPPATLARSGAAAGVPAAGSTAEDDAAARFAKPGDAPPTEPPKKSARSNKPFLFAGVALVILLAIVGAIFLRQPKDLKQMTTLDDGAPPIGLPALDDGAAPPAAKPQRAEEPAPAPAPVPAPPPEPEVPPRNAELDAAVEVVKDFPLDGGRGTVGRWLQYSYTASPGAGPEEWTPSSTADGSILVEYRVSPARGREVSYLFEVDTRLGLVIGKSLEARQMLAGSPPAETKPKPKPKPKAKAKPRRPAPRPVPEEEREVPLLPLPDSGELRPPSEDDASFGSDTINSGL